MTAAERKASQRQAGAGQNKANAERIDATLIRNIQKVGRHFNEKNKMPARGAHSNLEIQVATLLRSMAKSFPAAERRKVFVRFELDPADFLEEDGQFKEWQRQR